jgi:exodeoxyribonuclease-3
MQIATWNINGVKARLETALAWLKEAKPDVACLQEIKSVDEAFPRAPFEDLGYNVHTHGQKGFNGVAILSLRPMDDVSARLPGDDSDDQARYLEAVVISGDNAICRVGCLYLPNGNPVDSEKYPYKLAWMDRLVAHARERLALEEPFVLAGDYNIIPQARDAARPDDWRNDAIFFRPRVKNSANWPPWALPTPCAAWMTATESTPSGTTRQVHGKGTMASGSTI